MNNRGLLKRIRRKQKRRNNYYCFIKVFIEGGDDRLLDLYWTKNSWKTEQGWYILNEKSNYIHHTIKQISKILKGKVYKLRS